MLTSQSWLSSSALINAHNSTLYADHPWGSASASTTSDSGTMAYPAILSPFSMKLLPLVYRTRSGFWSVSVKSSLSVKSGLLENTSSSISKQSWSRGPASSVRKVAGFRVHTTSSFTCGFSHSNPWYWVIRACVSQWWPLLSIRVTTECGTLTLRFCPSINLSTSLTSKIVAAGAQRQGGPAATTESICLDRPATGLCQGLNSWIRTPKVIPFFSWTKRLTTLVTLGSPRAGALESLALIVWNAASWVGPHSRGTFSSPFRASCRGLAKSENPGIHIPAEPCCAQKLVDLPASGRGRDGANCLFPFRSQHPLAQHDAKT